MFSVAVDYNREEYLRVVKQLFVLEKGKTWTNKWYINWPYDLFLSFVFWLRVAREGHCTYEFSESHLIRKSRSGMSSVSWQSLRRVWALKDTYLIVGRKRGMVPVPKRCLTTQQLQLFEKFAENKLVHQTKNS